jgi:myo-inositol-1(or 4)-monophosphatase
VSTPDAAKLCDIAVSVARETGEMLASRAGRVEVAATKSSPTDVVTEMDRRAEALIRSRILAARPDDAILGEEEGQTGDTAGAPARWVVDPLDGTVNYLYGLHDWAVSIAVEVAGAAVGAAGGEVGRAAGGEVGGAAGGEVGGAAGGEVGRRIVAGAVFVPARGEMFSAFAGGGAWLEAAGGEPAPLRCGPGVPLRQALVGTGFGYLPARRQVQGEVVAALLPQLRDIRRIGVASADLCAVAAGRLDGFYERGLNYWDWAAGALVASEAGAIVGGLRGAPLSSSMAVAAGPALFGPLTEALAGLDPERDA